MKEFDNTSLEATTERTVLVGLVTRDQNEARMNEYLDELEFLADTAGAVVLKRFTQKLEYPNSRTFVGQGKLAEIKEYVEKNDIGLVIFDDDLSSKQVANIERELQIKVLDRSSLILDIFAKRAQTATAKTQVELAQYQYLLPRLTRMWTHLERQKGGIGMRGPGETQIETDRRIIQRRISLLKEQLRDIDRQKTLQRKNRGKLTRVALVGYTNVGKSTLMNLLSKSDVFAENKLFATLDTTVRKVTIENLPFLLTDTVGFIRKLPHQLVEAFKATLEELEYADLLLHVIDLSNPQWAQQAQVVDDLIRELKADHIPCLRVYNKCDLAFSGALPREKDSVYISAKTGEGIKRLLQAVDEKLDKGTRRVTIHLPYDKAGLLDGLYREAKVENVEYGETVDVTAVCTPRIMGQLKDYIEGWQEEKEDWEQ